MPLLEPRGLQRRAIVTPLSRINILEGSIRASKTVTANFMWAKHIREGPPLGLLCAIGKTTTTLRDNVLDPMVEMFGSRNVQLNNKNDYFTMYGRRIVIRSGNNIQGESKIRGLTLAGVLADEITTYDQSIFGQLLGRMSVPGAVLIGTTNTDGPAHWLKKNYLDRVESDGLDLKRWSFRLSDNPYLSEEYKQAISKEQTGLWYRRFIEGAWCAAEGVVYEVFDPALHEVTADYRPEQTGPWDTSPWLESWLAIDYGTTNPTVALRISLGRDQRFYVRDEWRWDSTKMGRRLTDEELATAILAWVGTWEDLERPGREVRFKYAFVDPSAASFIETLYRKGVRNVVQANNDVDSGVQFVNTLMSTGRLRFVDTCEGLLEEMQTYAWDDKQTEKGQDKPLKLFDHGPDALRYFVNSTFDVWYPWLAN